MIVAHGYGPTLWGPGSIGSTLLSCIDAELGLVYATDSWLPCFKQGCFELSCIVCGAACNSLRHCHGTRFQCISACVLQHGIEPACCWGEGVARLLNVLTLMLQFL